MYILSLLLLFYQLENDCSKLLKIILKKSKARNFNDVLQFYKKIQYEGEIHFFPNSMGVVLGMEENNTHTSHYLSGQGKICTDFAFISPFFYYFLLVTEKEVLFFLKTAKNPNSNVNFMAYYFIFYIFCLVIFETHRFLELCETATLKTMTTLTSNCHSTDS